jgi:dGTPase
MLTRELVAMNLPSPEKSGDSIERVVCDVIASMTDRYALALYKRLFFPSPMV